MASETTILVPAANTGVLKPDMGASAAPASEYFIKLRLLIMSLPSLGDCAVPTNRAFGFVETVTVKNLINKDGKIDIFISNAYK
jgi:hypothetical protein